MNLYLKYRPRTIDELDLEKVRKTLVDMVSSGKMAHAYLLTGPRGAGKTSTARVLARMVNCEDNKGKLGEPCNKCLSCTSILESSAMDVIEIDAASNRGIDDIRELKEKIRLAPSILRKKVYIIDEVHMLTTEAFNALLKTLEEPPSHSLFILCTTELHKVPGTIVSRCSSIQFTKASTEEMKRSFARVVAGEGAKDQADALDYLAQAVDGSFRDGVKILDQALANSRELKKEDIELIISGSSGFSPSALIQALCAKDVRQSLQLLNMAMDQGVDLSYLLLSLMRGLRDKLVAGEAELGVTKLIFLLDEVARKLASSLDGQLLIQVAIVEWCGEDVQRIGKSDDSANQQISKSVSQKVPPTPKASDGHSRIADSLDIQATDASIVWKQVLGSLGNNNMALDTILSKARPGNIQADELTLYVNYDFHRQQLMSEKNLVKLEALITQAVGREMRVKCEVSSSVEPTANGKLLEQSDTNDIIEEAKAIFS